MVDLIQMRKGTSAQWSSADPTLASAEIGVDTDLDKLKIGDGSTAWSGLDFYPKDPTQELVTLSADTTKSVNIPAGVKRIVYQSKTLTLSNSNANVLVYLYSVGDTVQSLHSGVFYVISSAAFEDPQNAEPEIGLSPGTLAGRVIGGEIDEPRNSALRTISRARGWMTSGIAQYCPLNVVADSAQDDDTIRFLASAGTLSGDIIITWHY